jgi:hypothetical protein
VEQLNLIVVKWGKLYTAEHVINLYEGAVRYTSVPFQFVVFTDNTDGLPKDKNWKFIKLPELNVPSNRGWWYKLEIFAKQHNLIGKNLYVDLDVIVIKDLKIFWDLIITDGLYICRDFNRQFLPTYQACNSSVMGWANSSFDYLNEKFNAKSKEIMGKYRGDQDYIQVYADSKIFWPDDIAMSWKWECWRRGKIGSENYASNKLQTFIRQNTRILVFHGQPKPEQCQDPRMIDIWKGTVKHK